MTERERAIRAGARAGAAGDPSAGPARRLAERAAAEGLADVAYASVDSPLGPLLVAATRRGLVRISYQHERAEVILEELAERLSPRVVEAPGRLDEVRRQLEDYFERRRRGFELPLDWSLSAGFTRRVLRRTAGIPYGRVATYAEVARAAGHPRAYRAAGNAIGANPIPIVVPCHRVVRAGAALGGYGGGIERKRRLLELEGALGGLRS